MRYKHRWGEIWHGGGHAKFHPHRCNVSPLRGEKPQNRPLSKLNTGRFVLRAMLPVKYHLVRAEPPFTVKTINWVHQTVPMKGV